MCKAAVAAGGPDWKKIGLWAVLLLGVLALAGMIFSSSSMPWVIAAKAWPMDLARHQSTAILSI